MTEVSEVSKKVVVVGASGFGRETLDVLIAMQSESTDFEIQGVADDFPSQTNLARIKDRGIPYLGSVEEVLEKFDSETYFLLEIGDPKIRAFLVEKFEMNGWTAFTAVHPSASIGSRTDLLEGTVVCAGAVISTNVKIGKHVHVNPHATIGHDAVIESFVSINPAAVISGEVHIHSGTLIGASATVLQGLVIGGNSIVGASACVTKSVGSNLIVKGVPAA